MPIDDDGCNVPDLALSEVATVATIEIDTIDANADPCLQQEGCVAGPGVRRVLVFDTAAANIGTGDMIVGTPSMSNPDFEYSSCHGHFHFTGFGAYDLLDGAGNVVAAGHKQAYCLRDDERVLNDPGVSPSPVYGCDGGVQGISRGWADVYEVGLPCQWVDITGVPAGDYLLRTRINPDGKLYELDHGNNELIVAVTIP